MTEANRQILLFDMDGVLLHAGGYRRALRATVAQIGKLLGFEDAALRQRDIELFEAAGATSEWDSSAICAALLLVRLWEREPQASFPAAGGLREGFQTAPHDLPTPDFAGFARRLAGLDVTKPARHRAEALLLAGLDGGFPSRKQAVQSILRDAHRVEGSLTHRLFQEYVLGSRVFEETYRLQPLMNVKSYLSRFDRPALSPVESSAVKEWLGSGGRYAAILTNRPSMPPDGYFCTPEAELGAELAGFTGLPVAGLGHINWLCEILGCQIDSLIKPSPVHALAALQIAVSEASQPVEAALMEAASALQTPSPERWRALHGSRVYVFEDAPGGLRSALGAQQILETIGIRFELTLLGITASAPKRVALEDSGAVVYPTLHAALKAVRIL